MIETAKHQCIECENTFELFQTDNETLCEYCVHARECDTPKGIEIYETRITGEARAKCKRCDFVSAYWECGCDLLHVCDRLN